MNITPHTLIQHQLRYLALDSRQLTFPSQSLFFAIIGANHNGHHFIPEAYQKGVRHFVISEAIHTHTYPDAHFYPVDNTIIALQQLVTAHRIQFELPIIGITGSNGKTVVKEWLYQLLGQDKISVRSPKSYNSQVGVPLSVWQLDQQHELGIFEAGISEVGEMARLQPIIQPTIGIFTNIGTAHSQGFRSDREKVMEKLQLFRDADYLMYCRDNTLIEECVQSLQSNLFQHEDTENHGDQKPYSFQTLTWTKRETGNGERQTKNEERKTKNEKRRTANEKRRTKNEEQNPKSESRKPKSESRNLKAEIRNLKSNLQVQEIIKGDQQTSIIAQYQENTFPFQIPFIDDASIENAIHCCLLMLHLGYEVAVIQERMKQLSPIGMRLELKAGIQNCSLINDCYNSDVQSLVIALDFLQQQNQHPQKTVILSDILQSGIPQPDLYQQVNQLLVARNIHRFIGIGPQFLQYASLFKAPPLLSQFFPDTTTFLQQLPSFQNEAILIKGARSFTFERITKALSQQIHHTILEINLNAIAHNLHVYKQLLRPTSKIMVMVKAFSYGSGSFEIANALQFHKVDYLAVAYTDEGVALRKAGIQLPIMVMNPTPNTFAALVKHQLEPEIYSFNQLQQFIQFLQVGKSKIQNPKAESQNPKSKIRNLKSEIRNPKSEIRNPKSENKTINTHYPLPTTHYSLPTTHYPLPTTHYPLPTTHYPLPTTHYPIHLKLDTGMHRLGFEEQEIPSLIKLLKQTPALKIISILSHLAASDEAIHDDFSKKQITQFEKMYQQLAINLKICPLKHVLNSTGIVRLPHAQMDMVRLGLGLYGIDTTNTIQHQLMTVGTLKTHITQIKTISPTETVGYGRRGKITQVTKIATVSIGYGDGLNRQLSNGKGNMWINGQLAPIIGNVCMDMTMLDISHIKNVQEGDEVIVFGPQLPVQQMATVLKTIPYEILTAVSQRVKRVYFQE